MQDQICGDCNTAMTGFGSLVFCPRCENEDKPSKLTHERTRDMPKDYGLETLYIGARVVVNSTAHDYYDMIGSITEICHVTSSSTVVYVDFDHPRDVKCFGFYPRSLNLLD